MIECKNIYAQIKKILDGIIWILQDLLDFL